MGRGVLVRAFGVCVCRLGLLEVGARDRLPERLLLSALERDGFPLVWRIPRSIFSVRRDFNHSSDCVQDEALLLLVHTSVFPKELEVSCGRQALDAPFCLP